MRFLFGSGCCFEQFGCEHVRHMFLQVHCARTCAAHVSASQINPIMCGTCSCNPQAVEHVRHMFAQAVKTRTCAAHVLATRLCYSKKLLSKLVISEEMLPHSASDSHFGSQSAPNSCFVTNYCPSGWLYRVFVPCLGSPGLSPRHAPGKLKLLI